MLGPYLMYSRSPSVPYPLMLKGPALTPSGGIQATNTSPRAFPPPLVRGGGQNMTSSGGREQDSMPIARPARTPTPLMGATNRFRVTLHGTGG